MARDLHRAAGPLPMLLGEPAQRGFQAEVSSMVGRSSSARLRTMLAA